MIMNMLPLPLEARVLRQEGAPAAAQDRFVGACLCGLSDKGEQVPVPRQHD